MNYLDQVEIGIDYIEANLDFDIDLGEVAEVARISQWHFQRIFKALTNETLKTYIRSRRLARALDKLLHTDARIIDIAFTAGFESQESFTRAFKKAFGMTPNHYRKLGDKNLFLQKVKFDVTYLRHINERVSLTPEIVAQPAMRFVGLKTNFYSVDSEKNNIGEKLPPLWDEFIQHVDAVPHAVTGTNYGIVQQQPGLGDLLIYYAAIEVTEIDVLSEGMEQIEIPAATYARFTHLGDPALIDNTVNYIYSSWLLQSGMRHTYGVDLEIYNSDYLPDSEQSIMHYAIPVR